MGKSCLMINDDLAENRGFWLEDGAIALNDGHTCLRDGDFVTLDTNRGVLYAGKQPIAQANMPELYREFVAYAKTVLARQPAQEIDLSAQVDFPEDAQRPAPIVGLSRVENYYLDEAGREVLLSAVLNPSPDNLAQVKLHTADYVDGLINGAQTEITFRLMDFKPDQYARCRSRHRHAASATAWDRIAWFRLGASPPGPLHRAGQRHFAGSSAKQRMGQKAAIFAIPHAETLADIDCARRIVAHAYNAGFGGFNAIRSSLAVTMGNRRWRPQCPAIGRGRRHDAGRAQADDNSCRQHRFNGEPHRRCKAG